ncbi:MAG: DUF1815 family protein [Cyanobacteriota bacterium]|jgi:hypothetical protein
MFARLAEQYRSVVRDLELSLQALAHCLQERGRVASCYVCGDGQSQHGVSFVADLGDTHVVRFLVSDFGITWVESRNGMELLKLEGADAIQELHRVAQQLKEAVLELDAGGVPQQQSAVVRRPTS